jgi:hypothetical protein
VELIVVVLGVLIALAADSWRETLQDKRRAESYVEAMVVELSAARDSLVRTIEETERYASALLEWRALAASAEPAVAPEIGSMPNVYVPTGTLDALFATGDFNLIGSDELRRAIVRERAVIVEARRRIELESALDAQDRLDWSRVMSESFGVFVVEGSALLEKMTQVLRQEPEFQALTWDAIQHNLTSAWAQRTMLASVERLIAAAQVDAAR